MLLAPANTPPRGGAHRVVLQLASASHDATRSVRHVPGPPHAPLTRVAPLPDRHHVDVPDEGPQHFVRVGEATHEREIVEDLVVAREQE